MIEIKSSKQLLEKIQIKRTEHKSSKYFQAKFHQFRKSSDPKTLESNNLKINESKNPLDMKFSYQTTLQNLIIFCLFDFGYLPKTVQRMFLEIDFIYSASKILWELIVIYLPQSPLQVSVQRFSLRMERERKNIFAGEL